MKAYLVTTGILATLAETAIVFFFLITVSPCPIYKIPLIGTSLIFLFIATVVNMKVMDNIIKKLPDEPEYF